MGEETDTLDKLIDIGTVPKKLRSFVGPNAHLFVNGFIAAIHGLQKYPPSIMIRVTSPCTEPNGTLSLGTLLSGILSMPTVVGFLGQSTSPGFCGIAVMKLLNRLCVLSSRSPWAGRSLAPRLAVRHNKKHGRAGRVR